MDRIRIIATRLDTMAAKADFIMTIVVCVAIVAVWGFTLSLLLAPVPMVVAQ
jgi:hypothetical protein